MTTSEPVPVTVVEIAAAALDNIAHEAMRSLDGLETGGILLGHDTAESITVRHAGGPGPNAQRGPRNFLRDRTYAQELADSVWQQDQSQWIGEWHTHPTNDLIPSELDLNSYLKHLHDPDLQMQRFLSVIVGLDSVSGIPAVAWLIDVNQARAVPLRRLDDQ